MWLSKQLPLSSLIHLCRVLRHNLGAGVMLRTVFEQQAQRGPGPLRLVAGPIVRSLERGDSLEVALRQQSTAFPPLFLALAKLGEQTGQLPEMFGELERHYREEQQWSRRLRAQGLFPLTQLVLGILVVAALIYVLSAIAESRGAQAPSIFGLRGAKGAILFLAVNLGVLVLLGVGLIALFRAPRHSPMIDGWFLRLPALGPCLRSLAVSRFAVALRLTLNTGMPIAQALRLSLEATGHAAFTADSGVILQAVRAGEDLTRALTKSQWFPEAFLQMVAVAEEGGRVPELMKHQAAFYQDDATRRMKTLVRIAGSVIWFGVALFMVIMILRLAGIYLAALGA